MVSSKNEYGKNGIVISMKGEDLNWGKIPVQIEKDPNIEEKEQLEIEIEVYFSPSWNIYLKTSEFSVTSGKNQAPWGTDKEKDVHYIKIDRGGLIKNLYEKISSRKAKKEILLEII